MSDINWYDTEDVVRDIRRLQGQYPHHDVFIAQLALEERLVKAGFALSQKGLDSLNSFVRKLYELEGFASHPTPVPYDLYRTVEGARRRDKLLNLRRRLTDPEQKLRQFKDVVLDCVAIFLDSLPSIPTEGINLATLRALDVIDVRDVIAALARSLATSVPDGMFQDLGTQMEKNVEPRRGKTFPSVYEFDGTPEEMVYTYLRETPFLDLFEMPIPFFVPDIPYRQEHTHILGPSGSGKTTLIQQLILTDLAKPDPPGMVVIDPKGLMVERLQHLDLFNPDTGRLRGRLVIVDPTHSPPPALNMFHAASRWSRMWSDEQRRRIENQAIDTFAFIFSSTGSKLTDKQTTPFSYAVRLMFHMDSTIHTLVDLMDDRTRTDGKGPKLEESKFAPFIGRLDDTSRRFFQNDFFSSNYGETRQQIKARIYGVLQHPEFVSMFEAPERKLDMLDCLQSRSIVLVNTAMNTMGSGASQLLGRYMIALTLNAAFARFTLPKDQWHQTHLIIDEFQEFADEEKTPELLRLAREYNLAVTLAHQEMHGSGMTEKVRSAISTNTTVKYASRPEGIDINYVARDMRCDPSFLTQQTKTATHARFACSVRGLLDHPVSLTIPFGNIGNEPQMSEAASRRLLTINCERLSMQPTSKPSALMTTREPPPTSFELKPPPDAGDPAPEW